MKSYMATLAVALSTISACIASPLAALEERAGKPTGGPASATVTVYSGPYTCASPNTPPPSDGSAGTVVKTFSILETQCVIVNVPFGGAVTSTMTATPKTGAAGCYIQAFTQQGCGVTLNNQYHGFPFNGITVGSQVGCAQVPDISYGAIQIVCG